MLHKEILSGNRIDTTNAFLDRSLADLHRKIAPESFLFTDPEISSLDARGKPSTVVYRAG